jgi:acyl-coenzyme A thioesterase PaaI-like protein
MVVSEGILKWAMRLYPPLLFQRIWVVKFEKGFKGVHVKINRSLLNINHNGSIFGGTIFSAADPFFPVLFHQLLSHKGYNIISWSKSAAIQYRKPAMTDLFLKINLTDDDIAACEDILNTTGKYLKVYPIEVYDKQADVCASIMVKIYVRNLNYSEINQQRDALLYK